VEFRNCAFSYEQGKPIIKNFNAKIEAGQKVAIVGHTGAGKTTMVNLLMRFFELDSGEILIDGIPTHRLTRAQVHDKFCMVLQDTWLVDGTIFENVAYANPKITREEVERACEMVGIDHLIKTMPRGYDTVLDANTTFSAGEAQLLTIARAVVKNAHLLILDEATSNVDIRTEVRVQAAMDKLTNGRTSFVIAHRLSTIRNADVILVMENGDIVEQGTHDELLKKRGQFYKLYTSQFETV
jgi:ATP-binding cassette subfamily B protein